MKYRIFYIAVVFCISLSACSSNNCEVLRASHTEIDRTDSAAAEKMYDGHLLKIEDRFEFCCMFMQGRDVSEYVTADRRNDGFMSIKLLNKELNRLRHNDTLKLYFRDKKPLVVRWSAEKLVHLVVKIPQTACDTVYNIMYEHIRDKIENIATSDKVTRAKLFDETVRNSIQKYLQGLARADAGRRYDCPQNVFIADMLNNTDSFGFAENEYVLPPSLRQYLDAVAQSVAYTLNQHKWENRRFTIDCTGFADQQRYTGPEYYSFRQMDIADSTGLQVVNTGCGFAAGFASLDKDSPDSRPALTTVANNCDLSLLRSFAAIHYLWAQLRQLTAFPVVYRYKGGGEAPGTAFEINRKIELSVEIKGVAEK